LNGIWKGIFDALVEEREDALAEAMEEGYFKGFELDDVVTLVNTMAQPSCNPQLMMKIMHIATEERLRQVIDTIFAGLKARDLQGLRKPQLHIAG